RPWPLLQQIMPRLENETEEQSQLLEKLCAATVGSTNANDIAELATRIAEWRSVNRLPLSAALLERLPAEERRAALEHLGGARLPAEAEKTCVNASAALRVRLAAVRLLDVTRSTGAVDALQSLLLREQPEPLQVAAAKTLIEWDAPGPLSRQALERWPAV